jgi:hypothetical protein
LSLPSDQPMCSRQLLSEYDVGPALNVDLFMAPYVPYGIS